MELNDWDFLDHNCDVKTKLQFQVTTKNCKPRIVSGGLYLDKKKLEQKISDDDYTLIKSDDIVFLISIRELNGKSDCNYSRIIRTTLNEASDSEKNYGLLLILSDIDFDSGLVKGKSKLKRSARRVSKPSGFLDGVIEFEGSFDFE